jgi:Na+/phosphate symporter
MAVAMLSQEVDKPVVEAYRTALTAFDEALKQAAKNSQTAAVAAADEVVDRLYTGLTLYLRSLTYHPVEATRMAAEGVLVIIDKYG